jgi:hypothetical protein
MRDPSEPWDDLKANVIALARALGQTVDDVRIEINPAKTEDTADDAAPQEDKPLTFEVGETVKIKISNKAGWGVDPHMYFAEEMLKYKGKIAKITELSKNEAGAFRLDIDDGEFEWTPPMFEKVPQPTPHEVIIDGVKYVREALK